MVAENDKGRTIVIELLQMLRNRPHRNKAGTLNAADRVLLRLADIDQPNGHGMVHEILDLQGLYFEGRPAGGFAH
jgi:hypothetical protein